MDNPSADASNAPWKITCWDQNVPRALQLSPDLRLSEVRPKAISQNGFIAVHAHRGRTDVAVRLKEGVDPLLLTTPEFAPGKINDVEPTAADDDGRCMGYESFVEDSTHMLIRGVLWNIDGHGTFLDDRIDPTSRGAWRMIQPINAQGPYVLVRAKETMTGNMGYVVLKRIDSPNTITTSPKS